MTYPRSRTEMEAIRTLVALHSPDTQPLEWKPEHHAAAETAAEHLAELLRRRDAAEQAKAAKRRRDRARTARRRPQRKPEPRALREGRRAVAERSGGYCEHPSGCAATAEVVHHRAGRVGKGAHHPDLLMHLCDDHHRWVHAHPAESYADGSMVRRNGVRFDPEEEI